MNRHLFRLTLALAATLLLARPADAGLLSWLDKLSGPGPFWGMDIVVGVKCFYPENSKNSTRSKTDREALSSGGIILGCVSEAPLDEQHVAWLVTVGGALANNNPLDYGDRTDEKSRWVGSIKIGSSLDYTVLPLFDIGAGGGLLHFIGPSFANFTLPYVESRLTLRPLLWRKKPTTTQMTRWGWLQVSVGVNILIGTVDGAKFGAPNDPLNVRNETRLDLGLGVDFKRLCRAVRKCD
jgi:hypothetical protein